MRHASLRSILISHLSEDELKDICFDYFLDLHNKLGDSAKKEERARKLVEYATQHAEEEKLLRSIADKNPNARDEYDRLMNEGWLGGRRKRFLLYVITVGLVVLMYPCVEILQGSEISKAVIIRYATIGAALILSVALVCYAQFAKIQFELAKGRLADILIASAIGFIILWLYHRMSLAEDFVKLFWG